MKQASHRIARAAISTVSACALGVGLAVPVSATPIPAVPGTDATALNRALSDPALLVDDLTERRLPTGAALQAETSSAVEMTPTEIARTATSATYRFTLPEGEVTREGAVLQGYGEMMGMRLSALMFITHPEAGYGAEHSEPYEQQLLGIQIAELISETFSIDGATVHSDRIRPGLVVPAGQTSVDITVKSSRTLPELLDAVADITGEPVDEHQQLAWAQAFQSRLDMIPETGAGEDITWRYGDPVWAMNGIGSPMQAFPNGGLELETRSSGTALETTHVISRVDGAPFSGDRVVATQSQLLAETMLGGRDVIDLISMMYPEPLQLSGPTTTVSGAVAVRNGFYRPEAGADKVTVTKAYTGPGSEAEARSAYETWVTETCEASLEDPIPGYRVDEDSEPMTWARFIDEMADATDWQEPEDEEQAEGPIYTGEEYIDAVLHAQSAIFDMAPLLLLLFGLSPDDLDLDTFDFDMVAFLEETKPVDWDEACGTTGGGEGPGDGDDEPGDEQQPASVTLDVPDAGVAGEPITLSATVLDDAGDPIEGQQVTFTIEEDQSGAGTLRAAALTIDPTAVEPTTLTATTGPDGVATVQYTPSTSGMLHVSASTAGANPVSSGGISLIPVTPAPGDGNGDGDGDGDGDDNDDDAGGEDPISSGSLGSLFGSLSS